MTQNLIRINTPHFKLLNKTIAYPKLVVPKQLVRTQKWGAEDLNWVAGIILSQFIEMQKNVCDSNTFSETQQELE